MALHDDLAAARTLLFVPGDRPERFPKAVASGADLVVLDLEDAVAPEAKNAARASVAAALSEGGRYAVRINAVGTRWFDDDLAMVATHDCAVMVPKAEDPATLAGIAAALPDSAPLVALLETAAGVLAAPAVAASPGVSRLALGSFDLAAQLGVEPTDRTALQVARSALVLASAAAGLSSPVDGVTGAVSDDALLVEETDHARRMGFGARLCIHPRQVPLVAQALKPSEAQLAWARAVLAASSSSGVAVVAGEMVDKPVLDRARRLLTGHDSTQASTGQDPASPA
jgi:citrate lyase subunit beta / citryl-CoA lyase